MKTKIENTDIPSERIIKLLMSSREFSTPGSIWIRIEPRYGTCANWPSIWSVMEKVRAVVRPGASPSDRFNYCTDKLNEVLEVHSVVEVFGSQKPALEFGKEISSV